MTDSLKGMWVPLRWRGLYSLMCNTIANFLLNVTNLAITAVEKLGLVLQDSNLSAWVLSPTSTPLLLICHWWKICTLTTVRQDHETAYEYTLTKWVIDMSKLQPCLSNTLRSMSGVKHPVRLTFLINLKGKAMGWLQQ